MRRFQDKVVLVTGAAAGIGRAAAERIANEGGAVFLCDLNESALNEVALSINDSGGNARAFCFDIAKEEQVNACISACVTAFGKLDAVVNMAGILRFGHFDQLDVATFRQVIDINLVGTFMLCKAALPELVKTKGNIVNAASTASLQGLPWGAAYGSSKGGVLSMTKTIAVEYAKRGVRANCVAPGDIKTDMFVNSGLPEDCDWDLMPRISSLSGAKGPEVVAGVIAMLASEDAVHITGEYVRVDGGTLA